MTSFQAAMTSVGAIVGSGNIAGIAAAIVLSGQVVKLKKECFGERLPRKTK